MQMIRDNDVFIITIIMCPLENPTVAGNIVRVLVG